MEIDLMPIVISYLKLFDIKIFKVEEIKKLIDYLKLDFSQEDILVEITKAYPKFLIDDIDESIYFQDKKNEPLDIFLLPADIVKKIKNFSL